MRFSPFLANDHASRWFLLSVNDLWPGTRRCRSNSWPPMVSNALTQRLCAPWPEASHDQPPVCQYSKRLFFVQISSEYLPVRVGPCIPLPPRAPHAGHALLAPCGHELSGIGGVARPGIVHRLDNRKPAAACRCQKRRNAACDLHPVCGAEDQQKFITRLSAEKSNGTGEIRALLPALLAPPTNGGE